MTWVQSETSNYKSRFFLIWTQFRKPQSSFCMEPLRLAFCCCVSQKRAEPSCWWAEPAKPDWCWWAEPVELLQLSVEMSHTYLAYLATSLSPQSFCSFFCLTNKSVLVLLGHGFDPVGSGCVLLLWRETRHVCCVSVWCLSGMFMITIWNYFLLC